MANSYIESSFEVCVNSLEELEWWKKEGKREVPVDIDPCDIKPIMSQDWELVNNDRKAGAFVVWFYGDPDIDVECAAVVIQRFLKECRPQGSCGFSWAETCSKPRLDSFGGGACFITATNISWQSSGDWLSNKYKKALDKNTETAPKRSPHDEGSTA